jgi:uncharacterized protein with von Willebrand factor type A (vWA) domain
MQLHTAGGQTLRNVVQFTRLLRDAGLMIGTDRTLAALAALEAVGFKRRDDVHAALAAVLVSRREDLSLFDAAFNACWRAPDLADALDTPPPDAHADQTLQRSSRPARLEQALAARRPARSRPALSANDQVAQTDTVAVWSDLEQLRRRDFDSMTTEEFEAARGIAAHLPLPIDPIRTRRHRRAPSGAIDLRDTLRHATRDPALLRVSRRLPLERPAPLVILCDISGSMERYARVMLQFAHGLMQGPARVHVFTFGTRLTDITRALRHRDPDEALAAAARAVQDWSGGTRIGPCLDTFTRLHARRALTGNAALLLVTDGLDRAEDDSLGQAAQRLARFTRQFIWLNPLLRFEGFEPRASGVRALLPHVDRHLPVHSLDSLADLARAVRMGRRPTMRLH